MPRGRKQSGHLAWLIAPPQVRVDGIDSAFLPLTVEHHPHGSLPSFPLTVDDKQDWIDIFIKTVYTLREWAARGG